MKGKVYLVGAGPGDPGLLTLRGKDILGRADVVLYDYLVNQRVLEWARPEAHLVCVGKERGRHTRSQAEINRLLVRSSQAGKVVARLKGGDPFLFGRGGEEAESLAAHGVPFEVVPGVTSAIAAPAYAGIPLTHRRLTSMVTIVTGHEAEGPALSGAEGPPVEWARISRSSTLVILMGMGQLSTIVERLKKLNWAIETPVAIIRWGTWLHQETLTGTLRDIVLKAQRAGFQPPATIIIGRVAGMHRRLRWFEKKPLFGRRIVVTRAREQASGFARLLEEAGAEVIQFPTIRLAPPPSYAPLDRTLRRLSEYDWMIFTSANGVQVFADRWRRIKPPTSVWNRVQTCAIGPKTAQAMASQGWPVTRVAKEYQAEMILPELGSVRGKRVLLPRASVARDLLPKELRRRGAHVEVIPLYRTEPDGMGLALVKPQLLGGSVDCVTFTASSTVTNFLKWYTPAERRRVFARTKAASIGPITSATLRAHGIRPAIEAKQATIESLAAAIQEKL
ncbi:MAG: uroporphyrinogen-III C-methyltransferase [Elusimicrobia bacterium]|nr:uroporphyrinogen-III C-methyltransferase [Elusimicrobiota bacterium]